jgi:FtsP/CotA-like multicopper oxidase with cupredoxin domain
MRVNKKDYCRKRTNTDAHTHLYRGRHCGIVVHNQLKESTSLHWNGVFLPNKHLTQQQVKPGTTYRFPFIQNGTYWYHSHSGLQEQIGMYGSFCNEKTGR